MTMSVSGSRPIPRLTITLATSQPGCLALAYSRTAFTSSSRVIVSALVVRLRPVLRSIPALVRLVHTGRVNYPVWRSQRHVYRIAYVGRKCANPNR